MGPGPFGKLHVRQGKGARGSGPRERMVPLIRDAGATLRWFIEDVWCCFDDDHARPGAPLFCSERRNADGTAARVGNETLRSALAGAAAAHLPDWPHRVTPHVLRHFCASQLYLGGMDLVAIQQALGHAWVATTMNYIHVHATHIEDAWITGQERAADPLHLAAVFGLDDTTAIRYATIARQLLETPAGQHHPAGSREPRDQNSP